MKTWQKILFSLALVFFVGASVWLSFNAISRPTYEYDEIENIGGSGVSGVALVGFNGNGGNSEVRVYHPMIKNPNRETDEDPAYIEDTTRNVVAIDKFTFVSDENMQYCYIGPDVQYIDDQAFFGCFALRAVYVDEANPYFTDIDGVLYTKDLKKMYIRPTYHIAHIQDIGKGDTLTWIKNAEGNDEIYETYTVPEGVETIATGCFYKTWGIKEIILPSTLKEIGTMSFFKCQSLKLINLPDGLQKIGDDAFSYCFSMYGALYMPSSVEEVGHHAFYKCNVANDNDIGELFFYMGAENEDEIKLGGRWLPKHDNKFTSQKAEFGKTREEAAEFNKSYAPTER